MVRIAPDANDLLVLLLNDGPTFVNTGTAGAAGNWSLNGNGITGAQGLFSQALYVAGTPVVNEIDGAGGANNVTTTGNAISLSGWVFIKRYTSQPVELFNKQYFLNAWNSPFLTFGFQMANGTVDGECDLFITTTSGAQGSGSLQTNLRTPTPYVLPLSRWAHIGGTWDGATMKFYVNGSLVASGAYGNNIDFNVLGNRGQWYCGGIPGTSVNQTGCAIFQDIRVANVVRPQSYFANIYFSGISQNG